MYRKYIFELAHLLNDRRFLSQYKSLIENQDKSLKDIKKEQNSMLRGIIRYAYNNVPYYHNLFRDIEVYPEDIKNADDLEKLPILTKDIIRNNWEDLIPSKLNTYKHYLNNTGGTTGTPFSYRISKNDRFLGGALLYRGWGYGGYDLADKMVFLAGSSIIGDNTSKITKKIHEVTRNIIKFSSFDLSEENMALYAKRINESKPSFVRGYPSAIYFFSTWVEENDIKIHSPKAIFTTAEKIYPHMRNKITDVFSCDVFDNYGLNDGGVSAYECEEHSGLHIDMERSVMEVADKDHKPMTEGEGTILATSLHNYAMPFIRYDTGDKAEIIEDECPCGRPFSLLKEITGRSVDIFVTPEDKYVHGWFFLYIFWKYNKGIKEYQVIQEDKENIIIKIVRENKFENDQLSIINNLIAEKSSNWKITYDFVDKIERTNAGKYKFIINKMKTM